MNIYNTLYFIEYSKDPILYNNGKYWILNLSMNCYDINHRDFDLFAVNCFSYNYKIKVWKNYDICHRLIGPAHIDMETNQKYIRIRGYGQIKYIDREIIKII